MCLSVSTDVKCVFVCELDHVHKCVYVFVCVCVCVCVFVCVPVSKVSLTILLPQR